MTTLQAVRSGTSGVTGSTSTGTTGGTGSSSSSLSSTSGDAGTTTGTSCSGRHRARQVGWAGEQLVAVALAALREVGGYQRGLAARPAVG